MEEGLLDMAAKARVGHYDDYRSPLATPIVQLVLDLCNAKRFDLAGRAANGEWDGTREEAEAWFRAYGRMT
jgi:hypothetical protein